MKALLIILAIAATALADEWVQKNDDDIKTIHKECMAENPIPPEDLARFRLFEYADIEPVRKYILCSAIKYGIFDEQNGYNMDRIVKQLKYNLDESVVTDIAEKCVDKNEEKSNLDRWTYRVHNCIMNSKIGDAIKEYVRQRAKNENS